MVGDAISYSALWVWVLAVVVLGLVIFYGIMRAGRLKRSERARLDANTKARQSAENPHRRPF